MWHYQVKDIKNPPMIFEPNLILSARPSFGQYQEHGFWHDPKQELSLRIMDFWLSYADSEI